MRSVVRSRAWLHASCAALVVTAACRSEQPRDKAPVSPAPPAFGATATAAASPDASAPPTWDATLAPGPLHRPAIALSPSPRGKARWLALVGDADVVRAAWIVGEDTRVPLDDLPIGTRCTGAKVDGDHIEIDLETRATLDQPSGLRATVAIDASQGRLERDGLARVMRERPAATPGATARVEGRVRAARALEHDPTKGRGAELVRVWQGRFPEPRGELAAPVDLAALAQMARDARGDWRCEGDVCEGGGGAIRFASGSAAKIVAVAIPAAPPDAARRPSARRLVPRSEATLTLEPLREAGGLATRLFAEAPLTSAGGSIGLGVSPIEAGSATVYLAVIEPGASRTFRLRELERDETLDARFADVDGDGRTDVVVRASFVEDGVPRASTAVYRTPGPSAEESVERDTGLVGYAFAAKIDDATQSVVAAPTRPIGSDEACRLVTRAKDPRGLRDVAVGDARLVTYAEPGAPGERPASVLARDASAESLRRFVGCPLTCQKDRPFCELVPKDEVGTPYMEYFWFTWIDGHARLAGMARYTGT